jgi:hypothetical protein
MTNKSPFFAHCSETARRSDGTGAMEGPIAPARVLRIGLWSVALSADGNAAIAGGAADNHIIGAAWVFTRSGGVWTQQGNKLVGTDALGSAGQGGADQAEAVHRHSRSCPAGGALAAEASHLLRSSADRREMKELMSYLDAPDDDAVQQSGSRHHDGPAAAKVQIGRHLPRRYPGREHRHAHGRGQAPGRTRAGEARPRPDSVSAARKIADIRRCKRTLTAHFSDDPFVILYRQHARNHWGHCYVRDA